MKETYFVMCPKNHFLWTGKIQHYCLKNKQKYGDMCHWLKKKLTVKRKHQINNNQKTE